ncbi:hypothetical protein BDW59DRAFT_146345 [Aspergillus cavernicola]|uniref:Uncharacterized protein n=1 Tax=Aspergillus cavernicola TaxID=176166 RepID=A0ABR4IC15_9EURO
MSPPSTNTQPLEVVRSAASFTSSVHLITHIRSSIEEAKSFTELVFTHVDKEWAREATEYLDETFESSSARKHYNSVTRVLWIRVMPTWIHDVVARWWHDQLMDWVFDQLLTRDEGKYLYPGVGTTFKFLQGPYVSSRKEPDFFIVANNDTMPKVVMESGWSESHNRLFDDMNLWLVGGSGDVRLVFILKWSRIRNSNRVRGWVEVYGLDTQGMSVMRQREVVFPVPQGETAAPVINIARRMFFGAHGPNPMGSLPFSIATLRALARAALEKMDLVPVEE